MTKKSSSESSPPSVIDWTIRRERKVEESREDYRTRFQVDRDRLLYTTNWARLAEITQVVSADHGYVFHNRLTHSLKVAQLARRLAEKLMAQQPDEVKAAGDLDPDVAEAAALAHDLGHPPFGHIAEEELDAAIKKINAKDGFEGNAQSFRLVAKLAIGDPVAADGNDPIMAGLNLTRATLNGILKYPWLINGNEKKAKKWGAYSSEEEVFKWVRNDWPFGEKTKSLEAELMDWADDITYAVHDVVDFYCAGKIPLERLGAQNEIELEGFFTEVFERNKEMVPRRDQYEKSFKHVCKKVFSTIERRYSGTAEEQSTLWQLMTVLISEYVDAISVKASVNSETDKLVEIDENCKDQIAMLKQLTWHYVILNTELATVQHGQRFIVRTVFETLFEAAKNDDKLKLFPPFYEKRIREKPSCDEIIRLVADYVSSMTEAEIVGIHKKLYGQKIGPAL